MLRGGAEQVVAGALAALREAQHRGATTLAVHPFPPPAA